VLLASALVVGALVTGGAARAAGESIYTAVGTGVAGSCCNGGSASIADINHPRGFAVMGDGSVLVVEAFGHRIRRVFPGGTITTVAGTGVAGYSGDGGPATNATLRLPHAVVALADGGFLIDDTNNYRIRRVYPDGVIRTVAGTGAKGFSGDGGPATQAKISAPRGISGASDGTFYIADSDNNRVRRVAANGVITTVAGTGVKGFSGDGGPAMQARLNGPFGVQVLAEGGFLISDTSNNRVRRVGADGVITSVAGNGAKGYGGDGGQAVSAKLNAPHNSTQLPDGTILIADTTNHRVRAVSGGVITTWAGTGTPGFSGEGGAPASAYLASPKALVPLTGGVLVADADNHRARYVGSRPWPAPPPRAGRVVMNGNATYARSTVSAAVPATGASKVRLSSSPATSGGVLTTGRTFSYTTPITWDLADPATGGSPGEGRRLLYAQWADGAGTWSPVVADSVVWDNTPPTATAPVAALATGTTLGTSTVPVVLTWTASDSTSGVASILLQRSTDGGPFTTVTMSPANALTQTVQLDPGKSYTFRVQPTDGAGNVGSWATAPTFSLAKWENSNPAVAYSGVWTTESVSSASGGTLAYTTQSGARATFTFTGKTVAWVAPLASNRGLSDIYVDGALVATVSQYKSSTVARRINFVRSWSSVGTHTVEVRSLGTSGRPRVDVDAFVVLG
jgi:hypothetical protein